jgi:WD40 repeat protein
MKISPGQVVSGHASSVQPPAFSPDGMQFVAGDRAGGLIIWDRSGTEAGAPFTVAVKMPDLSSPGSKRGEVFGVVWPPSGSLIASLERGGLRMRHSVDLSEAEYVGKGPLALGGDGAWLAVLGERWATLFDFPTLERRRLQSFSRGGFEYFWVKALAADPHGACLAVSDDGGKDETAMGAALDRGTPQVTLFDVERSAVVGAIEQGHYVNQLAFDPWRGWIITSIYHEMGVWRPDGALVRRFHPYEGVSVHSFAVTERWIATSPEFQLKPARLDLWDPTTFQQLATAPLPSGYMASWIVASPDGRTVLTPDYPARDDFGIRVWSVQE